MKPTVIVAGIARSGLSLTMQMLQAGGYPVAGEYPAFEPYPLGTTPWGELGGMAVKLVDSHLHLPPPGDYWVICLRRDLTQQARSTNKWLTVIRRRPVAISVSKLIGSFLHDYEIIDKWASEQDRAVTLDFEMAIEGPAVTAAVMENWLGTPLDCAAMRAAVVNRTAACYDGLLEIKQLAGKQ